eukprot:GSA120T00015286001.1
MFEAFRPLFDALDAGVLEALSPEDFLAVGTEPVRLARSILAGEEHRRVFSSGVESWAEGFAPALFEFYLETPIADTYFHKLQHVCPTGYWLYILYRLLISFKGEPESGEGDWKIM